MAVTKIHPIKTTLKKAIDYICNGDKTDNEIYVTTHLCSRENAHKEFELTKKQFNSRTKTLAHHLIQSFVPEEVSFEEAHQVGIELCEKILEGKYEYVLATHIDKDHIHNHIIFNSIDIDEGKVYHSYYGSYMNIRNQSDRLCKEHNLSVIDQETQKEINEIKRRKFVNWYDWNEDKKGKSYKSRLQFDMDRVIQKAINWEHFLKIMEQYGYEIKFGKHIAFKQKNQQRFTRAKTIGEDYTEERLKERIAERETIKTPPVKKRIGNIIDMNTNAKVKESKGYEYWATKHNLNTMAESVIFIREHGIKSVQQLDEFIKKSADERQNLQDKIKAIDKEMEQLSTTMEQVHIVKKYRAYYKEYKANPSDRAFFEEYKAQITLYENALSELKKSYSKLPNSRDILSELDKLQEKKNTLMQEYSSSKNTMDELYKIRKNYGIYMGKEMER